MSSIIFANWCDDSRYQVTQSSNLQEIIELVWKWPGGLIVATLWVLGIIAVLRRVNTPSDIGLGVLLMGGAIFVYTARLVLGGALFCQTYQAKEIFYQSLQNFGAISAGSFLLGLPLLVSGYLLTRSIGQLAKPYIVPLQFSEQVASSLKIAFVILVTFSSLAFIVQPVSGCVLSLLAGISVAVVELISGSSKENLEMSWSSLTRLALCAVIIAASSGFMISEI